MIDREHIWHPFTQEKTSPDNINIVRGKDAYLWDENGKVYLDLISSWWTSCHGHCNEYIAKAIHDQALKLDHLIFANLTHDAAINLIKKLVEFLHNDLTRFFFSDNGSTSIEIALKMTYQYWKNIGNNNRNLFVTLDGNYHGDTIGAMSLGKSTCFYEPFKKLMINVEHLPCPFTWWDDENIEEKEEKSLNCAKELLDKNCNNICALFLESLVQGASGMRVLRSSFINKICNLFQSYSIPVIFDEVMTGFGRTGTMFAYQQCDIVPDIICLSKALTGGFLPMALTITKEYIYQNFYDNNIDKAFLHGHSYTANPISCAAAVSSMDLFDKNNVIDKINNIGIIHNEELNKLKDYYFLEKFRTIGLISAFDIKNNSSYGSDFSNNLKMKFFNSGMIIRPLGNTIYLLPPYCISEYDLRNSYKNIINIIKENI